MDRTARQIYQVATLGFLVSLGISYPLWLRLSDVPTLPLFWDESSLSICIGRINSVLLVILALYSFFVQKKVVIIPLLACLVLAVGMDELKLQPWVYFHLLIMLTTLMDRSQYSVTLSIVIASLYFWSGISKLQPAFDTNIIGPLFRHFISLSPDMSTRISVIVAIIESSLGLCLLVNRTRVATIYFLIVMHLGIIITLLVMDYNPVVIPWNICLMFILIRLKIIHAKVFNPMFKGWPLVYSVIAIPTFLLPISAYQWAMNSTFSFKLYSGQLNKMYIAIPQAEKQLEGMLEHVIELKGVEGGLVIDINQWILNEINVPAPIDNYLQDKIAHYLCRRYEQDVAIIYPNRSDLVSVCHNE